ncbi:hypothetical protein SLEP1_g57831 [Rubroshorea leprosula]|uniref:Uncharacterized protein n=1 Tax=Rubroshorea leprosula TaxID=152421 RepID=A0AAV5MQ89_9ROSI|nr:hypothetical protein SLEP1_g57831 [Rubroshorea leprosula]
MFGSKEVGAQFLARSLANLSQNLGVEDNVWLKGSWSPVFGSAFGSHESKFRFNTFYSLLIAIGVEVLNLEHVWLGESWIPIFGSGFGAEVGAQKSWSSIFGSEFGLLDSKFSLNTFYSLLIGIGVEVGAQMLGSTKDVIPRRPNSEVGQLLFCRNNSHIEPNNNSLHSSHTTSCPQSSLAFFHAVHILCDDDAVCCNTSCRCQSQRSFLLSRTSME